MIEETRLLKQDTQNKMQYDDGFLVFPSAMYEVALELPDMEDGQGGYFSPKELEAFSPNNWKCLPLTDSLLFAQYSYDEDDEKQDVMDALLAKGLVDIRAGRKTKDITIEELVANGFVICTKRGIRTLQDLVTVDDIL